MVMNGSIKSSADDDAPVDGDNINVVIRVRPLNAREVKNDDYNILQFPGDGGIWVSQVSIFGGLLLLLLLLLVLLLLLMKVLVLKLLLKLDDLMLLLPLKLSVLKLMLTDVAARASNDFGNFVRVRK